MSSTVDHTTLECLTTSSPSGALQTQSSADPDYNSAEIHSITKSSVVSLTSSGPASNPIVDNPHTPGDQYSSAYQVPTSGIQPSSESGKTSTKTRDSEGTFSQITYQSSAMLPYETSSGAEEASTLFTKGQFDLTSTRIQSAVTKSSSSEETMISKM